MTPHALLDRLRQQSHFVGGLKVFLDKDVAALYGVSPGQLRRIVKRNIARFPVDFLVEENGQSNFSEAGVLMVSSILKSPQAAQVRVGIVRELFGFQAN